MRKGKNHEEFHQDLGRTRNRPGPAGRGGRPGRGAASGAAGAGGVCLQTEGFRVIESRVGSGSIDNCTVTAVRHGRELSSQEGKLRGQNTTVYVDLGCK